MTAHKPNQLPTISCPSSLIASCPPLLGYEPEPSVICLAEGPDRPAPVVVRIDLVPDEHAAEVAVELAMSIARTGADRVTIVQWVHCTDDTLRPDLPAQALVERLADRLADRGIDVRLAVATNGTTWWSLLCPSPSCCPPEGREVDAEVAGRVRLQYALAGYAPLLGRAQLADRLTAVPSEVSRTKRALRAAGKRGGASSSGARRRILDSLWRAVAPLHEIAAAGSDRSRGGCSPAWHLDRRDRLRPAWDPTCGGSGRGLTRSAAILALQDIRVRDALIRRIAGAQTRCRSCWQRSKDALTALVRACPEECVAPAATMLAIVAWLSGDGALATVANQRAIDADPNYRLAGLTAALLGSGLDPDSWRGMFAGLSEEACLSPRPAREMEAAG